MKVSREGLKQLLSENVIELRFVRRHQKAGMAATRRMLCTNSQTLLNNIAGKIALRFDPPTSVAAYNPNNYNLVFAWDILHCDYRAVSMESHDIISVMPLKTKEDMDKFWMFFTNYLAKLSPIDRVKFGNR